MDNKKTLVRFFTVADYEEEEIWLCNQHKNGWKLSKIITPCFYIFEKCTPENVAYRLDYKNNEETDNYFQIFRDYGWEHIGRCFGWLYFRKPLGETDSVQEGEIFSDNESRIDMINHVIKTRMLPLLIIFFACLIPNFIRSIETSGVIYTVLTVLFAVLMLIYLYLFIHCGTKLRKLKEKYRKD